MAQDNITRCLGLVSQYSPLSVQAGTFSKANNAVCDRENIIENRRGYAVYGTTSSVPSQLFSYRNRVISNYSSTLAYDNGSGTFTAYSGSYSPPAGKKMRSELVRNNLYVTTDSGVKVFSDVAGTAGRLAGAPRSLDPSYTLTGASGFLANSFQCAYRCVIQRTDANSNSIVGYPSQRLWVVNSAGGARNVILTLYLPTGTSGAITGDTVQFYRTTQVSGTATDLSGDTMKLAYQQTLTASDISTGYITFTDSIVDALLGEDLYTNATQEGIAQANAIPPLANDIAFYHSSYLIFANTSTKQRLYVTMVGTASLTGNTITLAGTTYNFGAAENIGTITAKVYATGVAAYDIDQTAQSLVRVINRNATNTTVYAYYLSGPSDLPGQIVIEERGVGMSAYTATASNASISGMFFPAPPTSGTTSASTSSNETYANRIYYSKGDEPEHVPLLNYLPVGPSNTAILRVAALRDSLIIIKEEGVYRLTGDQPSSFQVTSLDLTVYCKAIDSVVVLQNQVFMLSNQGIVSISDTGVQVVSREIEDKLKPILQFSSLATYTNAVAYESDRSYLLSTMSNSTDTEPNQIFRYNTFTRAWTRWTFGFTSATVETTADKLYFSKSGLSNVYRERKDFSVTDYADPEIDITFISISGSQVTFNSATTPLDGWALSQGGTTIAMSDVSPSGGYFVGTLIYNAPATWTTGAAKLYPNVGFDIEWNVWTAGQPGFLKQFQQLELLTDSLTGKNSTTSLVASFKTDNDQNEETVDIDSASYLWDTAPWGGSPWGGVSDTYAYPTWIPPNKNYGRLFFIGMRLDRANEHASIAGLSMTYQMISERISK